MDCGPSRFLARVASISFGRRPGLMNGISIAIQHGTQDHDSSEAVSQIKIQRVTFFCKKPEIFPDGQLADHRALNLLGAGCPVGSMMLVIFRILLVDLEIILRDIHKFGSQEHIADTGNLADGSE